jgi:hypothetical protein
MNHFSVKWSKITTTTCTTSLTNGLYFRPFAREVVHAVVVIFDHLPEKWFMLWLFLTICQRNGSCCDEPLLLQMVKNNQPQ